MASFVYQPGLDSVSINQYPHQIFNRKQTTDSHDTSSAVIISTTTIHYANDLSASRKMIESASKITSGRTDTSFTIRRTKLLKASHKFCLIKSDRSLQNEFITFVVARCAAITSYEHGASLSLTCWDHH